MNRLLLVALLVAPSAVALPAAAAELIGAETCKACHPQAYEAWKESPHARALDSLPAARRNDARCTVCHAPQLAQGAAGVTCETCHGGGRVYAQAYVMRDRELAHAVGLVDPGERTCAACHTDSTPTLSRFEYARKLPLIRHPDRAVQGRR